MEEIKAPKKERKFLKAVGNIAKVLANELVMGIARKFIGKAIDKVGNKKQGLVIAFALVAGISYASIDSIPYPVTGNKQRLGWQTTGNGLVYRGRSNDTITKPSSYVDKNVKAYLLLDSVRGTIFVWKQTYWDSILVGGGGSSFDTSTLNLVNRFAQKVNISDTANMLLPYFRDTDTSILNLQNRFNLKLNISDTAAMLLPYATKAYADTTGRLYARQDYTTGVTTSTLTWTQSDTLIPGGVTFVQVYRNGQILLPSQYTIPTSTSIVIAASSFKVGENYTVIFPRGGGAGSGGGSGSLTSISGGTGILVSPDPITTTGQVSADLSVLMELTDTTLLNLTSRFASKLNTTDTASLSNRINAKGNGTVTSVATLYGLTGGTITTTGTLRVDSNTVYNYVRDSIVKVRIGNDTIKILKQEYNNVTSDTLVWTTTVKFPIQLRSYILLFRNGQLLINDQFSIIDTNKIKVAASSYKLSENYTLVTVSGIGSAGVSQTGNPIYPEAGIALSTGTTWTTSITNNSTNWNTAYTDRLKWDGGSTGLTPSTGRTSLGGTTIGQNMFTLTNPSAITFPRFNDDNTITARSAANFRSDIGAGSVTTLTVAAGTPLSIQNNTTTPEISMAAASGSVNGYLLSTDWTTFNGKQNALGGLGFIKANGTTITYDNSTYLTTSSASTTYLAKTDTAAMLLPYFRDADTTTLNLTSRFASKLNISDTAAMLSNYNTRINSKLNISDTASMLTPYLRRADTSLLNLTSRFAAKLNLSDTAAMLSNYNTRINLKVNISDTLNMLAPYLRKADTTLMLSKYLRKADTSLLNLTSRLATKLNISDTAAMLTNYLRSGVAASTYLPLTGGTLTGGLTVATAGVPLTVNSTNSNSNKIALSDNGIIRSYLGANDAKLFTVANALTTEFMFIDTNGVNRINASGVPIQINSTNSNVNKIAFYDGGANTGYIASNSSKPFIVGNNLTTEVASISDAGNASFAGTLNATGATTIGSTLAVTGATTLSNLEGTSTRMVTVSSTGLLSAQSIPTGTVTSVGGSGAISSTGGTEPVISVATADFGTAGIVSSTGTQQFSGDKVFEGYARFNSTAYTATRIAGLSSTNRLSDVTLGSGLSLSGGVLSATEKYYFDLGTVAGQADNSTGTYSFAYSGNGFIVPSSLNGYCIDTVNIRAISCTNCPPAAGEKDYYMGVYKVSAGNRVTSTGATMQGSQIVCNEYDLKQENVNHVLTTGDVWWVYLNGSYFSDMEIIKASFIVKKTCN